MRNKLNMKLPTLNTGIAGLLPGCILLLAATFAFPAYAEDVAAIEDRLFSDNIEKLVKAVRAGKNIHIAPARADPNDNREKQLKYCSRLVSQMWGTIRPAKDFMPKPVYSTATHGNEFIRKFFLERVSRCEWVKNSGGDAQHRYAHMFEKQRGEPYFRVYENPKYPGKHILMQSLITKPRPEEMSIEEFVGSFSAEADSKESCFHFDDAELGGVYPEGPRDGILLFDGEIMDYTLGTTDAHCPADNPCPKSDLDWRYTYFLRLFSPNVGSEIFGPSFIKNWEKEEANGEPHDAWPWPTNYICTIYFN